MQVLVQARRDTEMGRSVVGCHPGIVYRPLPLQARSYGGGEVGGKPRIVAGP
jgi:hypothetical protein